MTSDRTSHPPSWHAILAAAEIEFDLHGFDGVRVEHVADRAGYNKSLVYRHFGGKDGLWNAVVREAASRRQAQLQSLPGTVAELLAELARRLEADPTGTRILLADDGGSEPASEPERLRHHEEMVALVRLLQTSGELEPEFDPGLFYLVLLGIAALPVTMPHVAEAVSGMDPSGPRFRERWEDTLVWIADGLAG
jgi:AcrR family transcriptional regulator